MDFEFSVHFCVERNNDKTKIGQTHEGAQETFKSLYKLTEIYQDILKDGYEFASCFLYLSSSIIFFNDTLCFYNTSIYNIYHLSVMVHHYLYVKIIKKLNKTKLIGAAGSKNTATFWIQMPIFCNKFKLPPLYFSDRKHERSYQAWPRVASVVRDPRPIRQTAEYQGLGKPSLSGTKMRKKKKDIYILFRL